MTRILFMTMLLLSCLVQAREVVGWAEKAILYPGNLEIRAKIDTGARTSSINCDCQHFYEKDGEQWVRFSVTNAEGETVWLDRKVQRIAKIKRHFGVTQERPVVVLGICLGTGYLESEVNVIDRSGLDYQLLIGRKFLQDRYLVDPEDRYINPPRCDIELND